MRSLRRAVVAALALTVAPAMPAVAPAAAQAGPAGLAFTPVPPTRLVDTRGGAPLQTGDELRVAVTGRPGVPAGTTAVAVNLTVTEPANAGWLDVRPCDSPYQGTSSINFEPGQTVANAVTVALGGGAVCVRGLAPGGVHVVADLTGAWAPAGHAFTPRTPVRVLDTRQDGGPLAPFVDRAVPLTDVGLVPPDAAAVAVQVTVADPVADGWVSAFPCAGGWTGTSTVNVVAGQNRSNLAMVSTAGGLCVRSMMPTQVVVDLLGWFGPDGLARLVPETPTRLYDSRPGDGPRPAGSVLAVPGAVPAGAVGAVLNVTTTESQAPGFVTVHPCGPPVPLSSNGNFTPGVTQATAAIAAAGPTGQACVLTSGTTQLVVDRAGWFVAPGPRPRLGEARVRLTQVATASGVTDLVARPGDGTGLYLTERGNSQAGVPGRVRVLRNGALTTLLELPGIVAGGETGLLGLAFSPDGQRAYVNYTAGNPLETRVVEYTVATDGTFSAARPLLSFRQPFSNHNGGDLEVDGSGLLYIASGDGGSGGDPQNRAQDLDTLLGKILRIDPRPAGGAPYGIPAGNPFAGRPGARPEIWAYGLRNPWRIDLDPVTGDLWIADVGQDAREEVNRGPAGGAGANYGWRRFEGTFVHAPGTSAPGAVPPRYEYGHDPDCSITGGFVYRGTRIPALAGAYVFSDFCGGGVRAIDPANPGAGAVTASGGLGQASTFGIGPDGELYAATISGAVYRLDPA